MPKATENRIKRAKKPVTILTAKDYPKRNCMICGKRLVLIAIDKSLIQHIGKFRCYNCDIVLSEKIQ